MDDEFTPETQPTGDYEVGYKKPPKSGRWKKGQSGNPKGRRKATTDPGEAARAAMAEVVRIPFRGKSKRMTMIQLIHHKAAADAAAGNAAARRYLAEQLRFAAQRESEQPGDREIICELVLEDVDRQAEVLEKNRQYLEEIRRLQGIPDWKVE